MPEDILSEPTVAADEFEPVRVAVAEAEQKYLESQDIKLAIDTLMTALGSIQGNKPLGGLGLEEQYRFLPGNAEA